jgi:hypothetical protein
VRRSEFKRSHRNGIRVPTREPIPYVSPGRPARGAMSASPAQRAKKAAGCRLHGAACGTPDAAHVVDRSIGGCDDPLCAIPLCRVLHEGYDRHELDILPLLTYEEQAHAVGHLGLLRALNRITGSEWFERLPRGARY